MRGKAVWITGAAGTLGRAIVHEYVRAGADVVASGRDLRRLAEVGEAAPGPGRIWPLTVDLTDRRSVDDAAERIRERLGRIDVLVNSVALPVFGDLLDLEDDQWLLAYDGKALGYLRAMRAVLPTMIRASAGSIVNLSGTSAKLPSLPSHVPGSMTNAAVHVLTKAVADRYGADGIRANCVAPGPIESPRWSEIQAANRQPEPIPAASAGVAEPAGARRSPYADHRPGHPEDVADTVLFLSRQTHINGSVIWVDGGVNPSL
ncbi:MAG: SDR family NAD(P)-dependent oxidoreductase [Lautropia sp.]